MNWLTKTCQRKRQSIHLFAISGHQNVRAYLPHITEEIFQPYFVQYESTTSIHLAKWPEVSPHLMSDSAEAFGDALAGIATEVRRYKSTKEK